MSKLSHRGLRRRPLPSPVIPRLRFIYLLGLAMGLVLAAGPAAAEDADEVYLDIYAKVQQADALKASGKLLPALTKYKEAERELRLFHQTNPTWNSRVVTQRLSALTDTIVTLSENANLASTNSAAGSAATGAPAGEQVKLLQAGAEPRQALRLHPKAGDKQTLALTVRMGKRFPPILLDVDTTVKEVSPQGDISYDMEMSDLRLGEDASAAPKLTEALKGALSSIKNASSSGTISARGLSRSVDAKTAGAASPQSRMFLEQLKDMQESLRVPLPEEAVGIGAKWELRQKIKQQQVALDQTLTFELASIEADRATLKVTLSDLAANQKISDPSMPGVRIDVTKVSVTGSGSITIDQTRLLPMAGAVKIHTEQAVTMTVGGQKQPSNSTSDAELEMESK